MHQKKSARQKSASPKSGRQRSAGFWSKTETTAEHGSVGSFATPSDIVEKESSSDNSQHNAAVHARNADTADEAEKTAELLLAVKNGAIRLLARREHSRTELRNKLLLRSHPVELIDQVLHQLAERDLQSDERFAESYTRMRSRRGYGDNKIRAELMSRDVDRDIIEAAIANTEECWIENASAVLAKKYPKYSSTGSNTAERAKMQRFLWSRGYNSEQVKIAVQRLTEQ